MNKYKIKGFFEKFTNGVIGGMGFSFAVAIISVTYASIGNTWTTPSTLEVWVGSGLTTSSWNGLLANFNNLDNRIAILSSGSIPTGLIAAFSGTACPPNWTEYTPARGRFLRGIDPSGSTLVDPSGTRVPGDQQADDFKNHNHKSVNAGILSHRVGIAGGPNDAWFADGGDGWFMTSTTGWLETRPKNVAVLYCIKS